MLYLLLFLFLLPLGTLAQTNDPTTSTPSTTPSVTPSTSATPSASASTPTPTSAGSTPALKVGFIYPNPPNDYGVVFQRDIARNKLEEKYPIFTEYSIASAANDSTPFEDFVKRGFKLIVACSVRWTDLIIAMSKKYLDVYWMLSPGAPLPLLPNLGSMDGKPYQSRYLSGIVAARYTKTKVIGYVNAIQTGCVYCYQQFNSFAMGVWSIDPNITIHLSWVGSWLDNPVAKRAARMLIDLGCDVISALTNSLEVQREASARSVASIGQHTDMRIFMGQTVLTSNAIDWFPIFSLAVEMALNNSWVSQNFESGLAFGGTQLSSFSFIVPYSIRAEVNNKKREIITEDRIWCGEDMVKYMGRNSTACMPLAQINSMSTLVRSNKVIDHGKYIIVLKEVYVEWSSAPGAAMAVVTSLTLLLAVIIGVWMVQNKENRSLKASSFEFCMIIWLGVLLALISIYFWIGRPSKLMCMGRVWLGGLGFIFVFSAVLTKNLRIWVIFRKADQLKESTIPNNVLLVYVMIWVVSELIILLVWQFQAPLTDDTRTSSFLGEDEVEVVCTSDSVPLVSTFFALKGLLVLACCVLAFLIRGVQDRFNESKIIAFNCYNFLILGSFVVIFVGLVSLNYIARFLITTIALLVIFSCVLATFFGYKMWASFETKTSASSTTGSVGTLRTHGSANGSRA